MAVAWRRCGGAGVAALDELAERRMWNVTSIFSLLQHSVKNGSLESPFPSRNALEIKSSDTSVTDIPRTSNRLPFDFWASSALTVILIQRHLLTILVLVRHFALKC
jgi:hypothetical protein